MSTRRNGDDDNEQTIVMGDGFDRVNDGLDRTAPTARIPVEASTDFDSGRFRTRFASEAVSLAERFNLLVGMAPIKGPVRYRVELSAPDGPSTGGGEQSVQHIKLIPTDGGATLVAGWCNPVERRAEVRTLKYLDHEHQRRFGGSSLAPPPLPSLRLDAQRYEELTARIRDFCIEQDFKLVTADAPEGAPTRLRAKPTPPEAKSGGGGLVWLLLLLFLGCVGTVGFLLHKKGKLPFRLRGTSQVGNQSR